ncbi:Neural-cadherin, partial [Armadillidium nasatum]
MKLSQIIFLMLDLCAENKKAKREEEEEEDEERERGGTGEEKSSLCYSFYKFPSSAFKRNGSKISWGSQAPLQVGGVVQSKLFREFLSSLRKEIEERDNGEITNGFQGCIAHLRINRELVDLGEPPFSSASTKHCNFNNKPLCADFSTSFSSSFYRFDNNCKENANCKSSPSVSNQREFPFCQCDTIEEKLSFCSSARRPVTLGEKSYASIALAFVPHPQRISIELKFKTKSTSGLLVKLWSRRAPLSLSLHISNGYLCLSFLATSIDVHSKKFENVTTSYNNISINNIDSEIYAIKSEESLNLKNDFVKHSSSLCLTKYPINDGHWHSVFASRLGHHLILHVDDGENWQYNETLLMEDYKYTNRPSINFWVDIREGVSIGGVPEYIKHNISIVYEDLKD